MWPFKPKKQIPNDVKRALKAYPDVKKRLFDAAKSEHFWANWLNTSQSIDNVIYEDHANLVAKSREQYANNDYVKRFVNLCQTNIVGESGVNVQSTYGSGNDTDYAIQEMIESYYARFSEAVDPAGRLSRADFESLAVQSCVVDGEAFILEREGKQYPFGVAYSFIDPILCPIQFNDDARRIRFGIRYKDDSLEIPDAYYFYKSRSPNVLNPVYRGGVNEQDLMEIAASRIIHLFRTEWVGQRRGIPWIATSLASLKNLDGFEEAAIIAARVGASKMGFFYTESGNEYSGESDTNGNVVMNAEPGSFEMLPEGVKIADWNPDYPNTLYGEFVSSALKRIAVGMGVSHHALAGDMSGVNYTSSRTALLDERDNWKRTQGWLINGLCRKMFRKVTSVGVRTSRLDLPSRNIDDYLKASYQGRRWQWVDPYKDMAAAETAINLGVRSRADVMRELGKNPETTWAEILKEREIMEELGLLVEPTTQGNVDDRENTDDPPQD
jgi:lambda family phage portal protein